MIRAIRSAFRRFLDWRAVRRADRIIARAKRAGGKVEL